MGNADVVRGVPRLKRFDLYVFDLDGTLIDSRRDLTDSVNALLVEHGAPPLSEAPPEALQCGSIG